MLGWLEEKRDELDEELSDMFQHVCDSIEGRSSTFQPASRTATDPSFVWLTTLVRTPWHSTGESGKFALEYGNAAKMYTGRHP
jgi:hypothetical protein